MQICQLLEPENKRLQKNFSTDIISVGFCSFSPTPLFLTIDCTHWRPHTELRCLKCTALHSTQLYYIVNIVSVLTTQNCRKIRQDTSNGQCKTALKSCEFSLHTKFLLTGNALNTMIVIIFTQSFTCLYMSYTVQQQHLLTSANWRCHCDVSRRSGHCMQWN